MDKKEPEFIQQVEGASGSTLSALIIALIIFIVFLLGTEYDPVIRAFIAVVAAFITYNITSILLIDCFEGLMIKKPQIYFDKIQSKVYCYYFKISVVKIFTVSVTQL